MLGDQWKEKEKEKEKEKHTFSSLLTNPPTNFT
jgi:hypothetical protein